MINLDISLSQRGAITFLLFYIVNFIWIFYCYKTKREKLIFVPSILLVVTSTLILVSFYVVRLDDSEHLHCAWLVSKGLVPYRDFWQHHSPMLWICLAPFIKHLNHTVSIFTISRLFCSLFFISISFLGWKIAQRIWDNKASAAFYLLLILSGGIIWQFPQLRPDIFMVFFLLLALYFLLRAIEDRPFYFLLSGIMLSFALSFIHKQGLYVFLPLIVISCQQKNRKAVKLILYCIGLCVGCLPLFCYLWKNNLIKEFINWVFRFNSAYVITQQSYKAMFVIIGCMGWLSLYKIFLYKNGLKYLVMLLAFLFSSATSLLKILGTTDYYLNFWLVLCAILGSGLSISTLHSKIRTERILVLNLIIVALIIPSMSSIKKYRLQYRYRQKMVISRLMSLCEKDTSFTVLPYHPIFSYDATRLYAPWQYLFMEFGNKYVKEDATIKDIVKEIIAFPPAVISYNIWTVNNFENLKSKGLISDSGFNDLIGFVNKYYTVKEICGDKFYIRNDKVGRYSWTDTCPKDRVSQFFNTAPVVSPALFTDDALWPTK